LCGFTDSEDREGGQNRAWMEDLQQRIPDPVRSSISIVHSYEEIPVVSAVSIADDE
jgi:hypothetical protein